MRLIEHQSREGLCLHSQQGRKKTLVLIGCISFAWLHSNKTVRLSQVAE